MKREINKKCLTCKNMNNLNIKTCLRCKYYNKNKTGFESLYIYDDRSAEKMLVDALNQTAEGGIQ